MPWLPAGTGGPGPPPEIRRRRSGSASSRTLRLRPDTGAETIPRRSRGPASALGGENVNNCGTPRLAAVGSCLRCWLGRFRGRRDRSGGAGFVRAELDVRTVLVDELLRD